MVGSVTQSQAQPVSFEEEALKRNTDCVYFLASPLTCKKGSECEYRHSDIARLNPRDCWYWLNSTCLNPKCAFRHPPLEGLLGMQTPASSGPSAFLPQIVTTSNPQAPSVPAKQGVPCVFFQKGHCLKGDWCTFVHVPSPLNNKSLPIHGTAPATEPATGKAASTRPRMAVQEKKVIPTATAKAMKNILEKKATSNFGPTPLGSKFGINNRAQLTSGINEFHGYHVAPSASNGSPVGVGLSGRVQQPHLLEKPESMNGKDLDEVSREPSPGFDVLVDDEGRDTEYYPGEERYGMQREHESRSEFDIGHSDNDFNMIASIDGERYQDALAYDSHEHQRDVYAWEQGRASSERMSRGSYNERKTYARPDAFSQIDGLDLRHRLAKHKKPNGLRSVISHEYSNDMQAGEESYQGLRRDDLRTSIRESSLSSRLRGRIRLPGRSPSPSDRNQIRSTDRGGLSPLKSRAFSVQGRIRDRIKGRMEEPLTDVGKNYRGLHRDAIGDMDVEFVGPKRLTDLKNKKNGETIVEDVIDQGSLGKRKHLMGDVYQQSGSDLSFEGPKTLQEILKRKRGETNGSTGGRASSNTTEAINDKNQEVAKEATDSETITLSGVKEETAVSISVPTLQSDAGKLEAEGPKSDEDGEDLEYEAGEQRDGDHDYEQGGGEDVDLYDDDGEALEEYVDDEDADEFAKKMGVLYS